MGVRVQNSLRSVFTILGGKVGPSLPISNGHSAHFVRLCPRHVPYAIVNIHSRDEIP